MFVRNAKEPGVYSDGNGLRFQVTKSGTRRWFVRLRVDGKIKDYTLGNAADLSLADARLKANDVRKTLREGRDPAEDLRPKPVKQETVPEAETSAPTFNDVWRDYWTLKAPQLTSRKTVKVWLNVMTTYVLPKLGSRPVADIRAAEVIAMLQPIWNAKEETARRALRMTDAVIEAAIVRELRDRASPCIGVAKQLGQKRLKSAHLRALPWADVPDFIRTLRAREQSMLSTRLSFEFLILTATRSGETRGALWQEIDIGAKLWTIPGNDPITGRRMKTGVEHVVPLSNRCIEILQAMRAEHPDSDIVFPGARQQVLSDMVFTMLLRDIGYSERTTAHGFRSSFKDWAAEQGVRDEVSEAALAHADKNQVRAAYRRTNFLSERRELMQRWADFCVGMHKATDVQSYRGRQKTKTS